MKKIYSIILFALLAFVSNAQVTIWTEDFSYTNDVTTGQGNPAITTWTADGVSSVWFSNAWIKVNSSNGVLEGKRTTGSNFVGSWAVENWEINSGDPIEISGYQDVSVTVDLSSAVDGTDDYVKVQYSLDGNTNWVNFAGSPFNGDFGSATATVSGLNGNLLYLKIVLHNTASGDYYYADNIVVSGYPLPPKTDFYADLLFADINQTVTFTDASTNNPANWTWFFSGPGNVTYVNGTSANSQNPQVQFDTYGFYSVSLVTNTGSESKTDYIDVVHTFNMGNSTQTTCSGLFYDSGGPNGDYSNGENYIMTFYPSTTGAKLEISFNYFDVEQYYSIFGIEFGAYMEVFDGTSTSATQIGGKYFGSNSPGTVLATNAAGALTFRFRSVNSSPKSGWEATINCIDPPANDYCSGAIAINEVTNLPFSTVAATQSGVMPGCGGSVAPVDIWYAYTATISGEATFDLCGSEFDTRLAIWDACGGNELVCNDDDCDLQSVVTLPVTMGTTYYVQVGGYNDDVGNGDLTIYVAGEEQNTLDFDGVEDYVSIANSADINTGGPYSDRTIEAWFYAEDVNKTTKQVIFEEGGGTRGLNIYIDNGALYVGGWNLPSNQSNWAGTWLSTTSISSQRWHHVTLRLENGTNTVGADKFKGFLDGVEFGSGDGAALYAHGGNISMGRNGSTRFHDGNDGSAGEYFEGKIEEFRIWNEARTLDDIKNDMYRELPYPTSEANLVAYFRFNQSAGNAVPDISGSGNAGTRHNMNNADWVASTAPIPYNSVMAGNWDTDATWNTGQMAPANDWARVVVNDAVTLNQNQTLKGLIINSSGTLTVNAGNNLTMDGNLTNSAGSPGLVLKADATGMASLIHDNPGVEATVEQHFSPNAWHLVSTPLTSAYSETYIGIYLYTWSEADSSFTNVVSTLEPVEATHGYYAWASGSAGDVQFQGTLNSGDLPVNWMTYTPQGYSKGDGWNLAGNPYPSGLKWDNTWSQSNLDPTVYVADYAGSGSWISYNYNTGLGSLPGGEIPPTQGFYVKANAASPSMTIPNSARVHTSNSFYKDADIEDDIFTIKISGTANSYYDQITLGINNQATDNFDGQFDAYQLKGLEDAPQLYSYNQDAKFSVDLFPEFSGTKSIPLGIETAAPGEYTLNVENLDYFDLGIDVYLEDKVSGSVIDLRQNSEYTFYTEEGTDESRFVLHFNSGLSGSDSEIEVSDVSIYSFANKIFVNYQYDGTGEMTVYDISGRIVGTHSVNRGLNEIDPKVGKGYYIVKVISRENVKTQKVYIK